MEDTYKTVVQEEFVGAVQCSTGTHSLNVLQCTKRNTTKWVHTVTGVVTGVLQVTASRAKSPEFTNKFMEQLASSWREYTSSSKCFIAKNYYNSKNNLRTNTPKAILVPNLGTDFIVVRYVSSKIRVTAIFTTGNCFVLNGDQITKTYLLKDADAHKFLSLGQSISKEAGHTCCRIITLITISAIISIKFVWSVSHFHPYMSALILNVIKQYIIYQCSDC
jgi:hypothetical protein